MYQVTKTYGHDLGLSACFRQWRADSHCQFLHGYALSFKLTFAAFDLDKNGWVIDFGSLKEIKARLASTFDHKLLVAADDPQLDEITALSGIGVADCLVLEDGVGCEAFAKLVYDWVADWLWDDPAYKGRVWIVSVEVREHGANSAIYYGHQTEAEF